MSIPRLDRHEREYRSLVDTARHHAARGNRETAATYAQIAAQHAWMNHPGRFASPELEGLLIDLGAGLAPAPAPARAARQAPPHDVLHVLTQAYQTGGSTREVACWLEQDRDRRHRICITRQGASLAPESLMSRLRAPTDLVRLDTGRGSLLDRAAALRALAAESDVVVLHVHPYDVVPVLAFAQDEASPPVIFVNHADHVFWLGTSAASVLMNMRESGRLLATTRRGVERARSAVMPRPLLPRGREISREEAKRQLGIEPDQVLLVTAADAPKYRPVGPESFLGLVVPAVERHPEAVLLAAGPSPEGPWREVAERTHGRIRALGRLPDVALLQQAADVYLDSFPFSSLTSLLEAGSFGTPTVTYRGHPEDCGVLGADTAGVDEHMLRPSDPEAFAQALDRLIADPAWRRDLGERTERTIRDTHTGDGWRTAIGEVYALGARLGGTPAPGTVARETGTLDVLVLAVMEQTGFSQGPAGALRDQLGLLPIGHRVAAWIRLTRAGALPPLRHVVPEWLLPHLGRWRRHARSLWQGAA